MILKLNDDDLTKIHFVARLLKKDLKYDYTHQQLAVKADISESKLRVAFKQVYNNTIHGFVTELRVEKAKEILETTGWSLDTVANHTGFKEPGRLIRTFKKNTGLTPLDWRLRYEDDHDGEDYRYLSFSQNLISSF